ncbi:MAG: hypothetical protein JWQ27_748 [Ferruginibacter sp.]|nr:hypothetical protein [Ferruginibacter sp.]
MTTSQRYFFKRHNRSLQPDISAYAIRFILLLFFAAFGSPCARAQRFLFKTYSVEDGLVSNPVRRIYQDSKGFMWIATQEGLSKYDGNKFSNYNTTNGLSHNMVNDVYESADGKLWVAENNGTVDILYRDAIIKKAAFSNVVINRFCLLRNGRVIAATDSSGLQQIINGQLVKAAQAFAGSTYHDFTEMNDSLLLGGSEGSLRILNQQFGLFSEIQQPKQLLTFKIFRDSKGRIWLGTSKGLKLVVAARENTHAARFILVDTFLKIPALNNQVVNDIMEDAKQNLWVATTNGLVKIYPDGHWQLFSEKDGLPSANITCLYQDREGNIWFGTALGLAKLVTKNEIRVYTTESGLASQMVSSLFPLAKHKLLIITDNGIQLYDDETKAFSKVHTPNDFFYYGLVQNSQPPLFFGKNNKVGIYDASKQAIADHISACKNAQVYCSIIDENGLIFSGTQEGLLVCSGGKFWYERKFPHRVTALLSDKKGYLWIGTWDSGLYRVRYSKATKLTDANQLNLSVEDLSNLLPGKTVRSLFEDSKKNIWVGTRDQGIVQINNNENHQPFLKKSFDIGQGLMSNFIRAIAEDKSGSIWIGSDLGIDKLIPSDTSFRVFNFSRVNNYFATVNAVLSGDARSLWFSTNNGMVNIKDGEMENTPPPPVYITALLLGDSNVTFSTHDPASTLQLTYDQNQVSFEFSSPAFINEKQVLYNYRLLGSGDTMWSGAANRHTVSYASLRPGTYRFEIRTMGWNGEWGEPAGVAFRIQPAFWQTGWFYILIACVLLLGIYSLYRYRVRQLLKLQQVRNRIATDLHDDIGSTLTNINMLSEISRKNLGQPEEAAKFLQRISEEVTASSQALNDIIWNVNTRNDSMEETLFRMRRYAAELFDNSKTTCHLLIDDTIAGKKINMEQRRDLYLIYKESMNNILKHAFAKNVWVDIQWKGGAFLLKIKDDGKGFESSVLTNRNGLRNIYSRTAKWKGSTKLTTAQGKGTLMEIVLPVTP